MDESQLHPRWSKPLGVALLLFGALTIKEGGSVILGDAAALAGAGAYVPFVVWFNAVAGFAYIAAAIGIWRDARWSAALAVALAAATLVVFAAFGVHVLRGGAYEVRTVAAMTFRSAVWLAVAALVWRRWHAPPAQLA